MKYTYSPIHQNIKCNDCGWEPKSYKNAQATASIHARKYRHDVEGELGIAIGYYGKDEPDTQAGGK